LLSSNPDATDLDLESCEENPLLLREAPPVTLWAGKFYNPERSETGDLKRVRAEAGSEASLT
jgi:hypothetical protein